MERLSSCPRCKAPLDGAEEACGACGLTLGVFRAAADLRRGILEARKEAASTAARLGRLEEEIATLDIMAWRMARETPREPPPRPAESAAAPPVATGAAREHRPEAGTTPTPETAPREPPPRVETFLGKTLASRAPPSPEDAALIELSLGQKWMLLAGIVVMVLGVGYFLKYSFERGWITPAGRVALAYATGLGLLLGGEAARRKGFAAFGLSVIGGGIATLHFASYAAFTIYELVPQAVAFGVMVAVTIAAGGLSLAHDAKWLAVLGLIGGFLTPVVLSTGVDAQVPLMTYMAILDLAILAIAFFKRWGLLNHLGLFFTWALFSAWYLEHYDVTKFWRTLVFLDLFFLAYAAVPFAYYLLTPRKQRLDGLFITIANSLVAFAYSYAMISERTDSTRWVSPVSLAYAAVFLSMAHLVWRAHGREATPAFVILLAKAMIFLGVTGPLLFTGNWITVFWAAQAAAFLWAALEIENGWVAGFASAALAAALLKLYLHDYVFEFGLDLDSFRFRSPYLDGLVERSVTVAFVLGAFGVFLGTLRRIAWKDDRLPGEAVTVLWVLFGAALFAALNVEVSALFYEAAPRARFAAISVLWTLFAVALVILGFSRRSAGLRRAGIALFAATLIKVFAVDMAEAGTPFRIISFIVLGLVLIGASFLYHRFKERILGARAPGDEPHGPP
jgi:uncharacterized membrane protein